MADEDRTIIQVRKKNAADDFSFVDMELLHQNCCGGKIESHFTERDRSKVSLWSLDCQRCSEHFLMNTKEAATVIRTAVDGQERETRSESIIQIP